MLEVAQTPNDKQLQRTNNILAELEW